MKHLIADTYHLIIIVIELRYNILIINFVKFGPKKGSKSHSRMPPKNMCYFAILCKSLSFLENF